MNREGGPPPGVDMEKLAQFLHRQEFEEKQQEQPQEEGSTQDFSFAETARELGFPREQWDNPQVRQFVGVWNHLLQIRHDLPPLATSASPTAVKRLDFGAHDGEVNLGPDPLERYRALDELTRAAFLILGEGLPSTLGNGLTRPRSPHTIVHAVNAALRSYGLEVVPGPEEQALGPGSGPKER